MVIMVSGSLQEAQMENKSTTLILLLSYRSLTHFVKTMLMNKHVEINLLQKLITTNHHKKLVKTSRLGYHHTASQHNVLLGLTELYILTNIKQIKYQWINSQSMSISNCGQLMDNGIDWLPLFNIKLVFTN